MATIALTDREKAAVMQGYIAGLLAAESGNLTNADRDALDCCRTISEQILTGGVYSPMHAWAFFRFFDEFFTPRAGVVIEAAHAAVEGAA